MKRLLIFLFVIISASLKAQSSGPVYRQFFYNPYTFNPAYAGLNNRSELGLIYRKQWVNFQDAPTTAGLSLQIPASDRVVIGFNILSDKEVLMKNSSFMTSFTYVVPLGFQESLRFGISGGIGMNGLNLTAEEMNTNDPVIINAAGNNYYINGNFGAVYTYRRLKVGFALTELFDSNPFNPDRFNRFNFSNLRNRLYSASYRFELESFQTPIAIEPYFLYRESEDGLQDYWEAATLVHFKETFWTGLGYNRNNGLALFAGLNLKEKFSFSYSYEFPPFKAVTFSASSHELQMNIRFGRERTPASKPSILLQRYKKKKPQNLSRPPKKPAGRNHFGRAPGRIVERESKPVTEREPQILQEEVSKPAEPVPSGRNYYLVVGSFQEKAHADNMVQQLKKEGHAPDIAVNPENHYYHVYLFSTSDPELAKKQLAEYKQSGPFAEAWIFSAD